MPSVTKKATAPNLQIMSPLELMFYWITERESIRKKREANQPRPWTADPILHEYRFCNVRRMDDKVSQWLLNNWYLPNRSHALMPLACVIGRHLNLPDALSAVGFPTQWNPDEMLDVLEHRTSEGHKNFNAAYVITGSFGGSTLNKGQRETKNYQVVYKMFNVVANSDFKPNTDSMSATHAKLMEFGGIGSFMAGQIVADMRWAIQGEWADKRTWAPSGPGSIRGMNRLLGRNLEAGMNQQDFMSNLAQFMKTAKAHLSYSITSRLEAQDYQSCFCEYDKFMRAFTKEGEPKQKYRPATQC